MTTPHPGRAVAARIGRVGVWANLDRLPAAELREFVRGVERLGFGALWYPETAAGRESFGLAALLLAASERVVVATGIASVLARDPTAMANGARSLAEMYPGRFLLGVGVSHRPTADARGHEYGRPVPTMRRYLDAMDEARYVGASPAEPPDRVLAALGPLMLRLARDRAAGAHPYFTPVEHTALARRELGQAPVLAVEQAVVPSSDAREARRVARTHTARYLSLENYLNNLKRLGWKDADLADGGSDRLVDAVVAHGAVEAVRDRVAAHLARGADHVCVQVLGADSARDRLARLDELAPALLALP